MWVSNIALVARGPEDASFVLAGHVVPEHIQ